MQDLIFFETFFAIVIESVKFNLKTKLLEEYWLKQVYGCEVVESILFVLSFKTYLIKFLVKPQSILGYRVVVGGNTAHRLLLLLPTALFA